MKIIQALKTKKQQVLRFLFGSFSATAIMFTFQACYGMPPAQNVYIRGTVVDAGTGEPVEGLMVGLPEYGLTDTTDANGTFDYPESQYIIKGQIVDLQVTDIDSTIIARLKGCRYDRDALRQALGGLDVAHVIRNMTNEQLIQLLIH